MTWSFIAVQTVSAQDEEHWLKERRDIASTRRNQ